MKFLLCVITIFFATDTLLGYSIPEPKIELLNPQGLRISIPHARDLKLVAFHVSIDKPLALNQPGDFSADITQPSNNRWGFDNTRVNIEPGNKISYWIHAQYGDYAYRKLGTHVAGGATVEVLDSDSSTDVPIKKAPENCEESVTTVGRKPVCKGQLIFEDNFDRLNWTMWKREVRIPIDADDSQFVSFQNRPENSFVSEGKLHIVPNLLCEVPGFNESMIRTGKLDLGAECTAIVDMPQECTRHAHFSQILPPVVSARINTKDFFSFRYGRVEVRARLPKGDWLFPLILLEPAETYYGFTGYSSGQMRVAFIRGNEELENPKGDDLCGKRISGGVVLATGEELRDTFLKGSLQNSHMGNTFHTYALTWTQESVSLEVDGNQYGVIQGGFSQLTRTHNLPHASLWNNGHLMAPFDREFFLTLGVAAGGHSDFPNGCLNGPTKDRKVWRNHHPKAELRFWNDRQNWLKSWNSHQVGLDVDYIKVYAL